MENEQQKYQGQVTEVCTNDGVLRMTLFVLGSRLSPLPELAICSARGQRWNLALAARVRLLPLACVAAGERLSACSTRGRDARGATPTLSV